MYQFCTKWRYRYGGWVRDASEECFVKVTESRDMSTRAYFHKEIFPQSRRCVPWIDGSRCLHGFQNVKVKSYDQIKENTIKKCGRGY